MSCHGPSCRLASWVSWAFNTIPLQSTSSSHHPTIPPSHHPAIPSSHRFTAPLSATPPPGRAHTHAHAHAHTPHTHTPLTHAGATITIASTQPPGSIVGIVFLALISSFSLQRLAICPALVHENMPRGTRRNVHEGQIRDQVKGLYLTYPAIGRACFGTWGYAVSWFGVVAMTLGVAGSYFVFITSTLAEVMGGGVRGYMYGTTRTHQLVASHRHLPNAIYPPQPTTAYHRSP